MKRKFLARPRALVKEIEKKLQLCYCNKSVIFNRDWENKNESEKTFRIKPIAVYQHDNITSRLMDWISDVNQNREHLNSFESIRLRGSNAGQMGVGPGLSSGYETDGQGLLSSQASSSPVPPVCPPMYQVSAYGSRLVCESVVSSSMVVVPMGLGHLQPAHKQ